MHIIYSPSSAAIAGIYLLGAIGSLEPTSGSFHRIRRATSFGRIGRSWRRQSTSFLISESASSDLSKSSVSQWHDILLQTRGGSSTADANVFPSEQQEEITSDVTPLIDEDIANTTSTNTTNATQPQTPRLLNFSATTPNDGSQTDPDGIPTRFLQMKKNNRDEAKAAFAEHLRWRERFQVDTLLSRPHPKYDVCKAMVPHYFSGRDPHDNIVFVQRPAMLDFEIMRRNNATIDDLLLHYIYVIEYCWNILDPGHDRIMTNVLDMRGISFRNMKNQEYIGFGKRFVQMMSANYPGRSYKTLIVNAPTWFHALYKIFKPLLRESTRQKIVILKAGEQQDAALKFYLGDSLPDDLITGEFKTKKKNNMEGGEVDELDRSHRYFIPVDDEELCAPGPNSLMEFHMRRFCISQLDAYNTTLEEVV
ncbi:hypothetical protein ACHAXS_004940 [Conticribra weissflogii]